MRPKKKDKDDSFHLGLSRYRSAGEYINNIKERLITATNIAMIEINYRKTRTFNFKSRKGK